VDKLELTFGSLIAYVGPGIITLYAISDYSITLTALFTSNDGSPSISSFFLLVVLSLMSGMVINCIGFLTIRKLFAKIGKKPPAPSDYARMESDSLSLANFVTDSTYRYYECYTNLTLSLLILIFSIVDNLIFPNYAKSYIALSGLIISVAAVICTAYFAHQVYCARMESLLKEKSSSIVEE
jgi:hypothetical protein